MDEGIKKVNDKISDRMKHIMKIWNTNVNIYEKNLQQVNKIVIKMLNKHENPSDTSKSKRQKQKQNECMTNILNTDANANVGRVR